MAMAWELLELAAPSTHVHTFNPSNSFGVLSFDDSVLFVRTSGLTVVTV